MSVQFDAIRDLNERLIAMAASSGEIHLLDSEREFSEAKEMVSQAIRQNSDTCVLDILRMAGKALSEVEAEKSRTVQVNRLFSNNFSCNNRGRLFGLVPGDRDGIELLTPLSGNEYIDLPVYYGEGMPRHAKHVKITREEWGRISNPFSEPGFGVNMCLVKTREAALKGFVNYERLAISDSVAIFEQVVGPKAGTDRDVGGMRGNEHVLERQLRAADGRGFGPADGQQDCIDEALTTLGFLELLVRQGFILYHNLQPQKHVCALPGGKHFAVVMYGVNTAFSSVDELTVVDSWPGDNGKPAWVLPMGEWWNHWMREFLMTSGR